MKTVKITKRQLRRIIREAVRDSQDPRAARDELMKQFEKRGPGRKSYPYGRYRGDVRSTTTYVRKDGAPISDEDMDTLTAIEVYNHPLGGIVKHKRSDDRMSVTVRYSKHTAG